MHLSKVLIASAIAVLAMIAGIPTASAAYYPNIIGSLSAYNTTKNTDAQNSTASREDFITYTVTARNASSAPVENFVFEVNISNILPFADLTDKGGANQLGENLIFPGLAVPAGSTVSKSFQVRVKYFLSDDLQYSMGATYGNTVTVAINKGQVKGTFTAPRTGVDTLGFGFAGMMVLVYAAYRASKPTLRFLVK